MKSDMYSKHAEQYDLVVQDNNKSTAEKLDINLDHKRIISSDGRVIDGIYHIQHVNGFISLWKLLPIKQYDFADIEFEIASCKPSKTP